MCVYEGLTIKAPCCHSRRIQFIPPRGSRFNILGYKLAGGGNRRRSQRRTHSKEGNGCFRSNDFTARTSSIGTKKAMDCTVIEIHKKVLVRGIGRPAKLEPLVINTGDVAINRLILRWILRRSMNSLTTQSRKELFKNMNDHGTPRWFLQ